MRESPIQKPFRILILSTPKTGNTWLLNLLSAMYDLPKQGLVYPFDSNQAKRLGDRWVVFHHLMPEPALVDWIQETQPFLLTTVRHPGDVLISLYHHIHNFSTNPVDLREMKNMLEQPFARVSIDPPAIHTFREELECSLAWKRTGMTRIVRYEDLRLQTMSTLQSLAAWIQPVTTARIEQAIEKCDIKLMRSLADKHGVFFRSGIAGEWAGVLSPGILETLRAEPYRSQMAELGYTLDSLGEVALPEAESSSARNPFRTVDRFENGTKVSPIIVDFYLSLDPEANARWPPVSRCGRGSFYRYIHGPCDVPGSGCYAGVFLSRIAHHIYRIRPDLQQTFPVLNGPDRVRFADWFIRHAEEAEYGIDPSFTNNMRRELVRWGNARYEQDRERRPWWPRLTNFTVHIYRAKPALQQAFPDFLSRDRWDLLQWMITPEHGLRIFPEMRERIRADLHRRKKIRAAIRKLLPR